MATPIGVTCVGCGHDASAGASTESIGPATEGLFPDFVVVGAPIEGGMGTVYPAHPEGYPTQRRALKVIKARGADTERRLRGEVIALQAIIKVPGVVPVLGSGRTTDGRSFLEMNWVEGRSLAAALADPLSPLGQPQHPDLPSQAAELASQLAASLDGAHGEGVLHRDIKPSNVMLPREPTTSDRSLEAVLIDFGIARIQQEGTAHTSNRALGTIEHLAPEVANGQAATVRTDVYLLAHLMFRVLTGGSHTTGQIHPSDLDPRFARDVYDLFVNALANRPELRPATCGEFAERLVSLLEAGERAAQEAAAREAAEAAARAQAEAEAEAEAAAKAEARKREAAARRIEAAQKKKPDPLLAVTCTDCARCMTTHPLGAACPNCGLSGDTPDDLREPLTRGRALVQGPPAGTPRGGYPKDSQDALRSCAEAVLAGATRGSRLANEAWEWKVLSDLALGRAGIEAAHRRSGTAVASGNRTGVLRSLRRLTDAKWPHRVLPFRGNGALPPPVVPWAMRVLYAFRLETHDDRPGFLSPACWAALPVPNRKGGKLAEVPLLVRADTDQPARTLERLLPELPAHIRYTVRGHGLEDTGRLRWDPNPVKRAQAVETVLNRPAAYKLPTWDPADAEQARVFWRLVEPSLVRTGSKDPWQPKIPPILWWATPWAGGEGAAARQELARRLPKESAWFVTEGAMKQLARRGTIDAAGRATTAFGKDGLLGKNFDFRVMEVLRSGFGAWREGPNAIAEAMDYALFEQRWDGAKLKQEEVMAYLPDVVVGWWVDTQRSASQ